MLNKSTAKSRYWKQIKRKKFKHQPIIALLHYVEKIKGEINSFSLSSIYLVICFLRNGAKT